MGVIGWMNGMAWTGVDMNHLLSLSNGLADGSTPCVELIIVCYSEYQPFYTNAWYHLLVNHHYNMNLPQTYLGVTREAENGDLAVL
jgi:hypothetical protein